MFSASRRNLRLEQATGQRNFLKLAKERGVTKFLAFLNSPPVYYTQNGLATNTGRGGTANLKPECYEKYARFLADVVEGNREARRNKVQLYLSFQRTGRALELGRSRSRKVLRQTNQEVARTVRLLSREFVNRKMDTQIMVNESSDYRCMLRTHQTDWQRGYQIQAFFCPDSVDTYLGDTPNCPD